MKLTYRMFKWMCVINTETQLMLVKKDGEPMHCMVRPDPDGMYRANFPCIKGEFLGQLDGSCEWLTYPDMSKAALVCEEIAKLSLICEELARAMKE